MTPPAVSPSSQRSTSSPHDASSRPAIPAGAAAVADLGCGGAQHSPPRRGRSPWPQRRPRHLAPLHRGRPSRDARRHRLLRCPRCHGGAAPTRSLRRRLRPPAPCPPSSSARTRPSLAGAVGARWRAGARGTGAHRGTAGRPPRVREHRRRPRRRRRRAPVRLTADRAARRGMRRARRGGSRRSQDLRAQPLLVATRR